MNDMERIMKVQQLVIKFTLIELLIVVAIISIIIVDKVDEIEY